MGKELCFPEIKPTGNCNNIDPQSEVIVEVLRCVAAAKIKVLLRLTSGSETIPGCSVSNKSCISLDANVKVAASSSCYNIALSTADDNCTFKYFVIREGQGGGGGGGIMVLTQLVCDRIRTYYLIFVICSFVSAAMKRVTA